MVYQHAEVGHYGYPRIHFTHNSVALAAGDVFAHKIVDLGDELVKKSVRETVFLECRIKQQPHEPLVVTVAVEGVEPEIVKHTVIVFFIDRLTQGLILDPRKMLNAVLTALAVE